MKTIKLHWKRLVLWTGIALIYLVPLFSLHLYAAVFAKYDGVDGESADTNHKDWIEVLSISQGVSRPINGGGGAGPRVPGPLNFADLTLTAEISKASPQLFIYCCTGQFVPEVSLEITKNYAGAGELYYYKVTMQDVLISSYKSQGSGDAGAVPTEDVSLNYGKITWEYQKRDDGTGTPDGPPTSGGWDVDNESKL
jgi:type VI secretion system secreted protein Hcp